MIKMKKVVKIILVIVAILVVLVGILMCTGLGREIREYIWYKVSIPQEVISMDGTQSVKVTYTYSPGGEEKFDIDVTDEELIKLITDKVLNKKLDNYTSQVGLAVFGMYKVDLGNDVSFKFDTCDSDGYVLMFNKDENFLTKIDAEILRKVVDIVDVKLTQNIVIFNTDKITVTNKDDKQVNIQRKTAIEYILQQCKNTYIKEINYEPMLETPNYRINFNNGIEIFKYEQYDKGYILKNGILSEIYGLETLDSIMQNTFDNVEEKEKMFNTNKITITDPNKSIEITDEDTIEKIVTPIIFSKIQEAEWTKNYDITEEYNNGIKIKLNNYEFLIPGKVGTVTIGNRYIISEDKKISLCFTLKDLADYINELLGNKIEPTSGIVSIQVPN